MYLIGAVATGIFGFIYFAHAEHDGAGADLPRHHAFLRAARHDVWPAGGVDRGMLHAAAALQRLLDRLSARLDYGRRPGAADCHGVAGLDWGVPASGYVIAATSLLCAVVSIIATLLMPDHTNKDISQERA